MMTTKTNLGRVVAAVAAAIALTAMAISPAYAQDTEVVAEGFNGPQGVMIDGDGDLWVVDAGLGGDETIEVVDTETGELVEAGFGMSAAVVRLDLSTGERVEVASLPSVATPGGGAGGARLVEHDGDVFVSVGEWARPDADKPAGVAAIVRLEADGSTTEVADTWAYELSEDPYPRGSGHSHPFGMASDADGRLLYADAGANAVMAVDVDAGTVETVAVFEPLPGVFPRPDYDGEMLTDPVPTAVVVQGDRTFVSLLSGAPFVPGGAKVVEVADDGSLSDHAVGLTMLTDLRAGPDGNLYATTFAVFGEQGPAPASGSVTRILPDGTTEVAVEGLDFVTSIDFASNGDGYVATNGVGPPGSGQIVRIPGLAADSSTSDAVLAVTGPGAPTLVLVITAMFAIVAGALLLGLRSRRVVERP